MNILGHCLLSGDNPHLLIGNFIADGLPRSKWSKLPASIQKGVRLHHFIDTFTDSHPKTEELIASLRPSQGKYAPVVSDLLIDHVLARDWDRYASIPLPDFVDRVHTELAEGKAHMTEDESECFLYAPTELAAQLCGSGGDPNGLKGHAPKEFLSEPNG